MPVVALRGRTRSLAKYYTTWARIWWEKYLAIAERLGAFPTNESREWYNCSKAMVSLLASDTPIATKCSVDRCTELGPHGQKSLGGTKDFEFFDNSFGQFRPLQKCRNVIMTDTKLVLAIVQTPSEPL
jgi:hypothetical protein